MLGFEFLSTIELTTLLENSQSKNAKKDQLFRYFPS